MVFCSPISHKFKATAMGIYPIPADVYGLLPGDIYIAQEVDHLLPGGYIYMYIPRKQVMKS